MQIVIDVSKDKYELIKQAYRRGKYEEGDLEYAVINGIVLPEEYGDLIDRSTLDMSQAVDGDRHLGIAPLWVANRIVENADVIIPAMKKEKQNEKT